jgi:hypothetical protein
MTMAIRCLSAAAFLGVAVPACPALAVPTASLGPTPSPPAIVAHGIVRSQGTRDLYSARARRMVQAYLRLRLLELREQELDRVRAVVEGRLGVDALFSPEPEQASQRAGAR